MASRASERALARSRQRFETRLSRARQSIEREVGHQPDPTTWTVPILAFAGGLAATIGVIGRLRGQHRAVRMRQQRIEATRDAQRQDD